MDKLLLRYLLLAIMLGVFSFQAMAVTFDSNAVVGNRRVELFWTPDEDDPVFTGNLEMFYLGDNSIGDHSLSQPVFIQTGAGVWTWNDDLRTFVFLQEIDDEWAITKTMMSLPDGVEVTSTAVHPLGILLLAGSEDGSIFAWRPVEESDTGNWIEYEGHEDRCSGFSFLPLATQNDSTFISVGADGYWRKWVRPGEEVPNIFARPAEGTGLSSIAITRSGLKVVVGATDGRLWIYSIAGASQLGEIAGDEHENREISDIIISDDGRRVVSADTNGHLRMWSSATSFLIGGYDPVVESPIYITFTPGTSNYIGYAHANGSFGIINGLNCQVYDIANNLGRPISGFSLFISGLRGLFLDEDGKVEWWYQGECIPSTDTPKCFGGYTIWRQTYADTPMVKLRVYNYADTTWGWAPTDPIRPFVDPDSIIPYGGDPEREVAGPHNGVPYYYSVTKYYWHFRDGGNFEVYRTADDEEEAIRAGIYGADLPAQPYKSINDGYFRAEGSFSPEPLLPRVEAITDPPVLKHIYVVPNPYQVDRQDSQFDASSPEAVKFFNLPVEATVRIFTSAGDLVRTIQHPQRGAATSGGECRWDLMNSDGKKVTSGVYIYSVDMEDGQNTQGFFTIIR